MKKTIQSIFLAGLALLAMAAPAQPSTEPSKKLSRYEREQGGSGGVFRRDPNIWVYTTQVARDMGMPMEWTSDELKGVVAAAFRRESVFPGQEIHQFTLGGEGQIKAMTWPAVVKKREGS